MAEENGNNSSALIPVPQQQNPLSNEPEPTALSRLLAVDRVLNVVVVKGCKMCCSPLRKEAEKMFEESKPYTTIRQFLDANDTSGPSPTPAAIRNHMLNHHKSLDQQLALGELCDRLEDMRQVRSDRKKELETLKNVGFHELGRCLTLATNGDIVKERIKNDVVVKTMRMILDTETQIGEMQSADLRVAALQQQFIKIWRDKINGAKSEEEKKMYIDTLRDFKKIVDGNMNEG